MVNVMVISERIIWLCVVYTQHLVASMPLRNGKENTYTPLEFHLHGSYMKGV